MTHENGVNGVKIEMAGSRRGILRQLGECLPFGGNGGRLTAQTSGACCGERRKAGSQIEGFAGIQRQRLLINFAEEAHSSGSDRPDDG